MTAKEISNDEEATPIDSVSNNDSNANGDSDASSSKNHEVRLASIAQVFSFGKGPETTLLLILGAICAAISGAVGPFMVFYFAKSYSKLSGDPTSKEFMDNVKDMSYAFLVMGAIAFLSLSSYSACLQTSASQMTMDLKSKWYQALLRQDQAYFDIMDVSGTSTIIGTDGAKYNRGVGNKLGMAIQFTVTFLGGLIYAFYASWRTALITLVTVPFMAVSGWFLVKMNTTQTQRSNASYGEAGSIVHTTITTIRTILSLNAVEAMIDKFKQGTEKNYLEATSRVHLLGLANGSMMSSFLLSNIAVPLYGGYLLYDQVRDNGCDPSGAVPGVDTCEPAGADIFGAMFGIFFAASVLPQISTTAEHFLNARAACYSALQVMNRTTAAAAEEESDDAKASASPIRRQTGNGGLASLPKYVIDSSSQEGIKPTQVNGEIRFDEVSFAYPTRQETTVLNQLSLSIPQGTTTALVGSSGSGKSTIAQLMERFYDPTSGSITLDGTDLKQLNVGWLRSQIGFIQQEPTLFACSIRENIAYGSPDGTATMEQIEQAARAANCYDFVQFFPNGFDTQVGDKGTKLSGGQKQRICIARALIKNPKILVLDEATSALDSESERYVQSAIDQLLAEKRCTTIIIAHRLSTIRNADIIAVMENGHLVEAGSHDELMQKEGKYYDLVQAQKAVPSNKTSEIESSASSDSLDAPNLVSAMEEETPILRFRDVTFKYPSRPDAVILKGLNLSVRNGEVLAVVGPSGHGKSTLVQLIERFYDPSEGTIEFYGKPLTDMNPKWFRSQIGLVSQEPTLFDTSIADNIRFGLENVTDNDIESAAREANAHDFIMSFPDGYDTQVGEGGTQVSGGQKQRICIARVLLRKTRLLLLDEATSALDSESERTVQEALDKVMKLEHQTTIVIAHRLSTIRNADRIAVVMNGAVAEIGSYEELMAREKGHFRRLQAFQNVDDALPMEEEEEESEAQSNTTEIVKPNIKEKLEKLKESQRHKKEEKELEEIELEAIGKDKEKRNARRAREIARGNEKYFLIGGIGGLLAGAMFPAWGLVFAYMIELLYTPVYPCDVESMVCEAYWDDVADDMKELSNKIAYGSIGTIVAAMVGYVLLFYGFGTATENLNKHVRDEAFMALIRQEVSYFDVRAVGKLTSQLQEDAALIHSFSGEPIRTLVINVSSVVVGIILGFYYMWPFAILFMGILPFLGFGAEMEMRMYVKGEDEGDDSLLEDEHSPGGIIIESLLNNRTIASFCLEKTKLKEYGNALRAQDPLPLFNNFLKGCGFGLGQFFQFWGIALMYWFGAWMLQKHPETYSFRDFIISMFALFFSLYGLTVALEGATDRRRAKLAADRIFDLIDRQSAIDPLSEEGFGYDSGKVGVHHLPVKAAEEAKDVTVQNNPQVPADAQV